METKGAQSAAEARRTPKGTLPRELIAIVLASIEVVLICRTKASDDAKVAGRMSLIFNIYSLL